MTYNELADALLKTGIISDAWLNGAERFRTEPIIISQHTYDALCLAAESIGNAYNELAQIVWNNPTYLDDFFHLTPFKNSCGFPQAVRGTRLHASMSSLQTTNESKFAR
jgi:hypothetical protein